MMSSMTSMMNKARICLGVCILIQKKSLSDEAHHEPTAFDSLTQLFREKIGPMHLAILEILARSVPAAALVAIP